MTSKLRTFVPGYSTLSRHNANAIVDAQDLEDTYLPAFQACAKGGAQGSMCSYNAVNGVPMCGNSAIETDRMRTEWEFPGLIVTDCDSAADAFSPGEAKRSEEETVRFMLNAGTDVFCSPGFFKKHIDHDMEELLERSLKRALTVRFRLGEFDPPDESSAPVALDQQGHLELARDAVHQSAVLLKNEGRTLPLAKSLRVALLGPLRGATHELLGDYSPNLVNSGRLVSPAEALKAANPGKIHLPHDGPDVCSDSYSHVEKPNADVVVIVGGIYGDDPVVTDPDKRPSESEWCQKNCLEAEGCDRKNISWPRGQQQLLDEAASWGLPVVLVVISGGPLDLAKYKAPGSGISSILWMGYPGQMGGEALADLLYGAVSPSGRLPQTFYSSDFTSATNIMDMRMRQGQAAGYVSYFSGITKRYPGRTYRFVEEEYVIYPFGYGLSYATWHYAKEAKGGCACTGFTCSFSFSLSAELNGPSAPDSAPPTTSVLIFMRPPTHVKRAGAPQKQLRGFERVSAASPASVTMAIDETAFMLADRQGKNRLKTGRWTVELGEPAELTYIVHVFEKHAGCEAAQSPSLRGATRPRLP
jgi:hypothetical protein